MISYTNMLQFLELSSTLSFTKAAQKLYISQQALSSTISSMEEEMGVKLFQRTTPLQLTFAGRSMLKYAQQYRSLFLQMKKEMDDIRSERSGELTIGISHTRGKNLLPHVLPAYQAAYPGIKIHIYEGNNDELGRAFSQGLVDLMIAQTPFSVPRIETVPLCREEVLLVVSDDLLERIYGPEKNRTLEEVSRTGNLKPLRACPFLLNKPGNSLRTVSDRVFAAEDFTPEVFTETENIETLYELCRNGAGCVFYPRMFIMGRMEYERKDTMHFLPLTYDFARFNIGIGYHRETYFSQAMSNFIDMTVREFQQPVMNTELIPAGAD